MRELSVAEAQVIESLLARPSARQSDEIRKLGLPRRTFQTIRQRVILRRWVEGRLTPDCRPLGHRWIEVAIVQPHLEARQRVVEAWNSLDGVVCLWTMSETLLAVMFSMEQPASVLVERARPKNLQWSHSVAVDLRTSSIPVFFDFEGAWAKISRLPPSDGYPRQYPPTPDPRSYPEEVAQRISRDLEWLFEHSPRADVDDTERSLLLRAKYRRRFAQAVEHGWATQRAFLQLATICTQVSLPAKRIVFVLGTLTPGATPAGVLEELRATAKLAPFLFLADQQSVIVGSLLSDATSNPDPANSPLAVLKRHCVGIHAVRERMESVTPVVDYRFDRLLLEARANGERQVDVDGQATSARGDR